MKSEIIYKCHMYIKELKTGPKMCHKFVNSDLMYMYFCVINYEIRSVQITHKAHKRIQTALEIAQIHELLYSMSRHFAVLVRKERMNYSHQIRYGELLTWLILLIGVPGSVARLATVMAASSAREL